MSQPSHFVVAVAGDAAERVAFQRDPAVAVVLPFGARVLQRRGAIDGDRGPDRRGMSTTRPATSSFDIADRVTRTVVSTTVQIYDATGTATGSSAQSRVTDTTYDDLDRVREIIAPSPNVDGVDGDPLARPSQTDGVVGDTLHHGNADVAVETGNATPILREENETGSPVFELPEPSSGGQKRSVGPAPSSSGMTPVFPIGPVDTSGQKRAGATTNPPPAPYVMEPEFNQYSFAFHLDINLFLDPRDLEPIDVSIAPDPIQREPVVIDTAPLLTPNGDGSFTTADGFVLSMGLTEYSLPESFGSLGSHQEGSDNLFTQNGRNLQAFGATVGETLSPLSNEFRGAAADARELSRPTAHVGGGDVSIASVVIWNAVAYTSDLAASAIDLPEQTLQALGILEERLATDPSAVATDFMNAVEDRYEKGASRVPVETYTVTTEE